ncbi:tetratricopeptide repeat protein [Megalodesulfovibrio paquesii]
MTVCPLHRNRLACALFSCVFGLLGFICSAGGPSQASAAQAQPPVQNLAPGGVPATAPSSPLGVKDPLLPSASKAQTAEEKIMTGIESARRGAHEVAVRYFTEAIDSGELSTYDKGTALKARALAWFDRGNMEEALKDFSAASSILVSDPDVFHNRANIYLKMGRNNEAKPDLERAQDLYFDRGSMWLEKDDLDKAISDFTKAILLDGRDADAYLHRAIALKIKGDLDKAILDYTKSIELHPDATAYSNRGNAWLKKGDLTKAKADYDKAESMDPGYPHTYFNRAQLFLQQGNLQGAMADINKALNIDKEDAQAYATRGAIYARMGNTGQAQQEYTKAKALDPQVEIPQ